ncbi:MAG TPA: four-helix bundle copper-binding protein [Burkholderiales bacterium]|nr:four-helix bundle copper-binding protein [Burkholderiales bacterium]
MPEIIPTDLTPADHLDACVEACSRCARICLSEAMEHCLRVGGKHTETQHFGLMLGCAEICRATADYLIQSPILHNKVCGLCAEICEACAHSCAEVGDMQTCVDTCRHCADLCRRMSLSEPIPA